MKTFRNFKKQIKRVTQKQHATLDKNVNMYAYEDIILSGIGRYIYSVER